MAGAAEWDLTSRICEHLDRHLILPLYEFLEHREIYELEGIQKAKLDLLSKTNMVDFAVDIHKQVYPNETPTELMAKRGAVLDRLKKLQADATPIIELLEKEDVQAQIAKGSRDASSLTTYLEEKHGMSAEGLDILLRYAQEAFAAGNYALAEVHLYQYVVLAPGGPKSYSASWGRFAANILMQNWEAALEDLNRLKDYIASQSHMSPLQQLQQRTWLIHWSLFVFFNHPQGRDSTIDLFLYNPEYLNTIQTTCPWILRYLTTAVITNKRRRNVLKDLVKVIQQESYSYSDPITDFLLDLYVDFDFDGAQKKLRECETVLANDFFLVACREEFVENARIFVFEVFCRIHNTISISMLAEKLNMDEAQAEQWIVNLIRNARLDAKIDSKLGHVVMSSDVPSVYSQVIDKVKSVPFRSAVVIKAIDERTKSDEKSASKSSEGKK